MDEKYKEALLDELNCICYQSRVTKDSSKECIILKDNRRIDLYGKKVWNSEKSALGAIKRHIITSNYYHLNARDIWNKLYPFNLINNPVMPEDLIETSNEFKKNWAEKHLRVIKLRDYMAFEHNRNKEKK